MERKGSGTPNTNIISGRTYKCSEMNRFQAARIRAGLSRTEAADRIGVGYQSLGDYENGYSRPVLRKTWRKMEEVYGCTIADLLGVEVVDSENHRTPHRRKRRKGARKVG